MWLPTHTAHKRPNDDKHTESRWFLSVDWQPWPKRCGTTCRFPSFLTGGGAARFVTPRDEYNAVYLSFWLVKRPSSSAIVVSVSVSVAHKLCWPIDAARRRVSRAVGCHARRHRLLGRRVQQNSDFLVFVRLHVNQFAWSGLHCAVRRAPELFCSHCAWTLSLLLGAWCVACSARRQHASFCNCSDWSLRPQ